MIKNITTTGRYLQVSGGGMNPYFSPGAQGAGQLRYNTTNGHLEVWDGVTWREISSNYASVGLTGEAEGLLDWVRGHRAQVMEQERLMQSHPAVKDLKEKLDMMVALVREEERNGAR